MVQRETLVNVKRLVLGVLAAATLSAQTAQLTGFVKDPSDALIPGAMLRITNELTNVSRTIQTNETGFYSFSSLEPGQYRMHVEASGFQSLDQDGITLRVAQKAQIDFTLPVGQSSQSIVVDAGQQTIQLTSQTIGYVVNQQMIAELPLNGRNILQLMQLAPDAGPGIGGGYQQGASRPEMANSYVSASGGRGASTAFYLDGGLNEDALTNIANIFPNPDAIDEFAFDTNSHSAKYGGRGGGVMNAVTRRGTNQFHGSLFEFVRNTEMNARNFFAGRGDGLKRNQYGGAIGGPVSKDKTFFFFSYQGTKIRRVPVDNVANALTAAQRAGDFSLSRVPVTNPDGSGPFPGGRVPTSLFDPVALRLLERIPVGAPVTGLVYYGSVSRQDNSQYVGRFDHHFNESLRIYGSYLYDSLDQPDTTVANNLLTAGDQPKRWTSQNASVNAVWVLRPTLLSNFVTSVSRRWSAWRSPEAFPGWSSLGVNVPNMVTGGRNALNLSITSYFSIGYNGFYALPSTLGQAGNHWNYVRGEHSIDFGGRSSRARW